MASASGGYTGSFLVPQGSPGYARVSWSVTGSLGNGIPFERGGFEDVQIMSSEIAWAGILAESVVPCSNVPGALHSLQFVGQLSSSYAGAAQISADLVDGNGNFVTSVTQPVTLTTGWNTVSLTFSGAEIYASGLDPARVTNLVVLDTRGAPILAVNAADVYSTFHRYTEFAACAGPLP